MSPTATDLHAAVSAIIARGWTTFCTERKLEKLIDEAEQLFYKLLDDPPAPPFNFPHPLSADNPDSGLIYREGEKEMDGQKDRKVYLQFHPSLLDELLQHNPSVIERHGKLLVVCYKIWMACSGYAQQFMQEVDNQCGTDFVSHVSSDKDALRLLAYTHLRDDSTEFISREHVDRGLFTIALRESHPGLEVKQQNGLWVPVSSEPMLALGFADGAAEELSGGKVKALRHRVRLMNPNQRVNSLVIRFAMVYFGHHAHYNMVGETH